MAIFVAMAENHSTLDATDLKIVSMLAGNAKLRIKEMAGALGLSTTPVFERIKKLEASGIIRGYHAEIDHKKLGRGLLAICSISLQEHRSAYLEAFERDIVNFEEVVECYHVAGQFDYLLKVRTSDMDAYQRFVAKKLASIHNIARVQSSFVMTEVVRK